MNSDPVHPLPGQNISWSKTKHDRSLLFIVSKVAVIPVRDDFLSPQGVMKWVLVMATLHPPLEGVQQLNFSCTECRVHLKQCSALYRCVPVRVPTVGRTQRPLPPVP